MDKLREYLFIICGATGSGKSTLADSIISYYKNFVRAPKYSTRTKRSETDDIIHVKKIDSENYDLAYMAMGNRYGIRFHEINNQLQKNYNSVLVTTDFRIVSRLKAVYGSKAISICVLSAIDPTKFIEIHGDRYDYNPSKEQKALLKKQFMRLESAARLKLWKNVYHCTRELLGLWQDTIPEKESLEIRTTKVRDFQTKYFENRQLFDYTILNYREGHLEDLINQFHGIVRSNSKLTISTKRIKKPLLFLVAAASGSGKGLFTETLNDIAPNEIGIVSKQGKRGSRANDRRDGMLAIGTDGQFGQDFNLIYEMHKGEGFKGIEYAFSEKEIKKNLSEGKNLIAIANVLLSPQLWKIMKNLFGEHLVVIYLLRFEDEKKLKAYHQSRCKSIKELQARMSEINETYVAYVKNISEVDHVILNTAYPEDLFDQMFRLLEYYRTIN
jgi:guanylate kinase